MQTLTWCLSLLSAVIGFSAISISIFGTMKTRSRGPYMLLILFYGSYTLQTFVELISDFTIMGSDGPSAFVVHTVRAVSTVLGNLTIVAAALFFHVFFTVKARRIRDILVIMVAGTGIFLFSLPSAITIVPQRGIIELGSLAIAASIIYFSLFAYTLIVGFTASKRDRTTRELILIWTTLGFGMVGITETSIGTLQHFSNRTLHIEYSGGDFSYSLIPHILTGLVMIYYFGAYILAEQRAPSRDISDSFLKKYNITQREKEVIALMDRGLSNQEIADKLFISLATIKTHAHNVYDKTGAKSRYDLFHLIREQGL